MSGAGAGEAAAAGDTKLQSPLLAARSAPQPAATTSSSDGGGHEVSGQLESILGDGSLPWPRRMASASAVELRLLARLAAPAVAVYMTNYLMSMSTQIFSGHLGTLELAAASLGNNGIQIFAYGLMVSDTPGPLSLSRLSSFLRNAYLCDSAAAALRNIVLLLSCSSSVRGGAAPFVLNYDEMCVFFFGLVIVRHLQTFPGKNHYVFNFSFTLF
jgi:MATE family multidrug resistance protein